MAGGKSLLAAMTQQEVADEMTRRGHPMSKQRVQALERQALQKLRENPEADALFRHAQLGDLMDYQLGENP